MIVTLTLNPAIDKTVKIDKIQIDGLNRLDNVETDIGGKGINVSKTIKALHGNCKTHALIAGVIGQEISDYLHKQKFTSAIYEADGSTRVNLKIVDADGNLTEFNEAGPIVNPKQKELFLIKFLKLIHANDIVVLSGSVPRGFSVNVYEYLCVECKKKGAKVIIDADGPYFSAGVQGVPNVIKPNRYELMKYYDIKDEASIEDIIKLAQQFVDMGIELVTVSMGSDGSLFVYKDAVYRAEGLKVDTVSTVGAGDAMVAAIAFGMDKGMSREDMMALTVATCSATCTTKGTKAADYETIQSLLPEVVIRKIK